MLCDETQIGEKLLFLRKLLRIALSLDTIKKKTKCIVGLWKQKKPFKHKKRLTGLAAGGGIPMFFLS